MEPIKIVLALGLIGGIAYLAYLIRENQKNQGTKPGSQPGSQPGGDQNGGTGSPTPGSGTPTEEGGLTPLAIAMIVFGILLVIFIGILIMYRQPIGERISEFRAQNQLGQEEIDNKLRTIELKALGEIDQIAEEEKHFKGAETLEDVEKKINTAAENGVPAKLITEVATITNEAWNKARAFESKVERQAEKLKEKAIKAQERKAERNNALVRSASEPFLNRG
jgi:hypothetical protein